MEVVVNTRPTRSTPWVVVPEEVKEEVRIALIWFAAGSKSIAEIRTPPVFNPSSLPRYYKIVMAGDKIVDIEGVRRDGTPTKWGLYRRYWHPLALAYIIAALSQ